MPVLRASALVVLVACAAEPTTPSADPDDTAPSAPSAPILRPPAPFAGQSITCEPTSPNAVITWLRDDHPAPEGAVRGAAQPRDTVAADSTTENERWTCRVTARGLHADTTVTIGPPPPPPNLLLIVADDLGVDQVAAYGAHPRPPRTPSIDALAAEGVRFDRAYGYTSCSPSRAALLTGRHGRRTGIGRTVSEDRDADDALSLDEVTLPELLRDHAPTPYQSAAIGKWHLAASGTPDAADHPRLAGFDHHRGALGNLGAPLPTDPENRNDYHRWIESHDGLTAERHGYITTTEVDDALAFITATPDPWLVWLAFHAPHTPLHAPPPRLRGDLPLLPTDADLYRAMVESMDTEIGRLLDTLDPAVRARTWVVVLGDNGTPDHGVLPPWSDRRAKSTLFEGGTHIPLIVAGPGLPQRGVASQALVHITDVFATLADLGGVPVRDLYAGTTRPGDLGGVALDGRSLLPVLLQPELPGDRAYVVTERFAPNHLLPRPDHDFAVRDHRWRLLVTDHVHQLYDLGDGWLDGGDVLPTPTPEAQAAERRLSAALDAWLAATPPG